MGEAGGWKEPWRKYRKEKGTRTTAKKRKVKENQRKSKGKQTREQEREGRKEGNRGASG